MLTAREVSETSSSSLTIRRVEKHLPHNKAATNLYEVTMPEYSFRSNKCLDHFRSKNRESLIQSFYELGTTQTLRSLLRVGCVCRVNKPAIGKLGKYALSDLKLVEQPTSGKYLSPSLSFRKIFMYERLHTRSRTGLVVVFVMDASNIDTSKGGKVDLTSQCFIWAVKPGGDKAQRTERDHVTKGEWDGSFGRSLQTVSRKDLMKLT